MSKTVTTTPAEVFRAGREIKAKRVELFRTLAAAEEITGIPIQTLSQLERGDFTRPSAELLGKISNRFGIPFSTLLGWYGYEYKKEA